MAVDLYFFSNVTLGYGSPKYINFIKECAKQDSIKSISTIEPMEGVRKKYQLSDVNCKRLTVGDALWRLPILNVFLKSYTLSKFVVKPINSVLLSVFILFLSLKSHLKQVAVVTTFDHPLFGCLSSKTLICQNFSEIWQENTDDSHDSIWSKFKGFFIQKYRKNVKFLIAPQEDRLALAKAYYPSAKTFLIHNAPSQQNNFEPISGVKNKVILYQGRISQLSLADKLIEFAEGLPADVQLHIAGIVNKEYLEKIDELNKRSNITFHGYLKWDDLAALRSQCNIGILAWSNDSLNTKYCAPNKLYEYIASGMYVICFDNYSLAKLHKAFDFGHVEKGSALALVEHVNALTEQEIMIQGKRNHQLYLDVLNFEHQHQAFFNAFFSSVTK